MYQFKVKVTANHENISLFTGIYKLYVGCPIPVQDTQTPHSQLTPTGNAARFTFPPWLFDASMSNNLNCGVTGFKIYSEDKSTIHPELDLLAL